MLPSFVAVGAFNSSKRSSVSDCLNLAQTCELKITGIAAPEDGRLGVVRTTAACLTDIELTLFKNAKSCTALAYGEYSVAVHFPSCDAQPLLFDSTFGKIAIVFAGKTEKERIARSKLANQGVVFHTNLVSETVGNLVSQAGKETIVLALCDALWAIGGDYCCLLVTARELIGVCSSKESYSLYVGENEEGWVITNQLIALERTHCRQIRKLTAGEILLVNDSGLQRKNLIDCKKTSSLS